MAALPVFIGPVPLTAVTSFVLTEGYKIAQVAGNAGMVQMIAPNAKTIEVDALLVGGERSLRPALEALALLNRAAGALTSPLQQFTGIPVVARLGVHLDMQITSLTFTQENTLRDTMKVKLKLEHVPRHPFVEAFAAGLDLGMGAAAGFLP